MIHFTGYAPTLDVTVARIGARKIKIVPKKVDPHINTTSEATISSTTKQEVKVIVVPPR